MGQNFLADLNTVKRIVRAAEVGPGDLVLEIGPGLGSLTEGLLLAGASVVAIEKDAGLARVLVQLFESHPNVAIVHGDALKTDLARLVRDHLSLSPVRSRPPARSSPTFPITSPPPY